MILEINKIKELILDPKNKKLINRGIQLKKQHELHVVGVGIDRFIDKIDGIENDDYVTLKKRFAAPYTVKVFEKALRPVDKLWNAKGGTKNINVEDNKDNTLKALLLDKLYSPTKGKSLTDYLQKVWGEYSIWVDPMGLILIERNTDDSDNLYLRDIPIAEINGFQNIHDIDFTSSVNIEYLILNEGKDENDNNLFRVIDDAYDYMFMQSKENKDIIIQLKKETFKNVFYKVPAVINSSRIDKISNKGFTTYCYESIATANDYLSDFIDSRIYKKKLGIPKFWEYKQVCEVCGGEGKVVNTAWKQGDGLNTRSISCHSCGGSGYDKKKVLTDIARIDLLEKDVQNYIPPAGVVTIPIEIQELQVSELEKAERDIIDTIWGNDTSVESERKNTTAFEISVRSDQKLSKLESIDKNRVLVEKFIYDIYGEYYLRDKYLGTEITPSNQYILTNSSEAREIYINAKKAKLANYQLDKLYLEYLEAEFENNSTEKERQKVLLLLNPLPHLDILEAKELLSPIEITIKKNFERYIYIYENEKPDRTLLSEPVQDIYLKLAEYAIQSNKINKVETEPLTT